MNKKLHKYVNEIIDLGTAATWAGKRASICFFPT